MTDISQSRAQTLFSYNGHDLVWLERSDINTPSGKRGLLWNRRYAGTVAGWVAANGYRAICIGDRQYLAHRLVWIWHHGELPPYPTKEIDHINGNKLDNRIANLRPVDRYGNDQNAGLRVDNKSGFSGVFFAANKWTAYIRHHDKQIHIGSFDTIHEAAAARIGALKIAGFHENHGKKRRASAA